MEIPLRIDVRKSLFPPPRGVDGTDLVTPLEKPRADREIPVLLRNDLLSFKYLIVYRQTVVRHGTVTDPIFPHDMQSTFHVLLPVVMVPIPQHRTGHCKVTKQPYKFVRHMCVSAANGL